MGKEVGREGGRGEGRWRYEVGQAVGYADADAMNGMKQPCDMGRLARIQGLHELNAYVSCTYRQG